MSKHTVSTVLGGLGALLTGISLWLGFYAIKGLAVAAPVDNLPPAFEFMLTQTKVGTLTLAACVLISGAVFIVGACIVHHLEDRRP